MSDGWRETTLGEIASWGSGGTPRAGDPRFYQGGTIPWAVIADLQNQPIAATNKMITTSGAAVIGHLAPAGSVLVSMYGTIGRVALAEVPMATNQAIAWGVADPYQVDPKFLFHWLRSHQPVLEGLGRGATQRNINRDILKSQVVHLPPLEVQRRIVDLIVAVDASSEALAAEAMAGADAEGPLVQALVDSGSEGAESLPLGEVGEFIRGRRFTKDEYVSSGLGCIHYGQIHTHFGPVARQSLTFLLEESRSRLHLARPGDVVIAATSEDLDGLGKATVWLGDDDVAVHDDCYIFRHGLDPKFASYVFASPWFQQQKRQYAGGTKVTRISGSDLARIAIPIPPLAVQIKIGEALSALSEHVSAVRVELDAVRQLRASMLRALLSRRVEIPESYDELLNRVAEEHREAS